MWEWQSRQALSCLMVSDALMTNAIFRDQDRRRPSKTWCKTLIEVITDPGMCNTNLNMVHVRVDLSLPENQDPKPELEDNEFIECFTLPLSTLFSELKRLEAEGYAIDARVGTLAEGIELAKKLKL